MEYSEIRKDWFTNGSEYFQLTLTHMEKGVSVSSGMIKGSRTKIETRLMQELELKLKTI